MKVKKIRKLKLLLKKETQLDWGIIHHSWLKHKNRGEHLKWKKRYGLMERNTTRQSA